MSIASMTTIAVARNLRAPTNADAGVATKEAAAADDTPKLTDILVKTVPVGLVSAYTAFIAVVTEVINKPTTNDPEPEQYLVYRWIAFGLLIVLAVTLTVVTYRQKAAAGARFPRLEVSAVAVASAAWGLGIPESPLLAAVRDKNEGLILLALIALIGVGINSVLSAMMQNKKT